MENQIGILIWYLIGAIPRGAMLFIQWNKGDDLDLDDIVSVFICGIFGIIIPCVMLYGFLENNRHKTIIRGRKIVDDSSKNE
jgi:hypothetical protein